MKIKVLITILLILCINLITLGLTKSSTLNAQTEEELIQEDAPAEIDDFSGLRAELNQYTQDASSKEVTFEMVLKSNVDSDRVRVTWELEGRSIFAPSSDIVVEM